MPGEEFEVSNLLLSVFFEFIAPCCSSEGGATFRKIADADALSARFSAGHLFMLAVSGHRIIGVLEMCDQCHVALLFVDRHYQRKGVAKTLLEKSVAMTRKQKPKAHLFTVNASPNAFSAYKHLGFIPIGFEKVIHGIRFVPMAVALDWLALP